MNCASCGHTNPERASSATWHARAARSDALRNPTSAIHHWRRVRELLASEEDAGALRQRAEACRELLFTSWRIGVDESEWNAVYEEGTALARRIDDKRTWAMLLSSASLQHAFAGELRAQVNLLEEALPLTKEIGDFALEASLHQRIGWAWGIAGDTRRDLEWTERGIQLCESDPSRAGRISSFDTLAWLYAQHGWGLMCAARLAEAERELERADGMAAAVDDPFTRMYVRSARFQIARYRLDLAAAARWSSPSDGDLGAAGWYDRMNVATARIETEDWQGAVEAAEAALAGFQALGTSGSALLYVGLCAVLAQGLAGVGDAVRAREVIDQVRRDLRLRPELRQNAALLLSVIPAVLAVDGAAGSAETAGLIEELLGTASERGFVMAEPFAFQFRGELAALLGDKAASERDLRSAAAVFRHLECGARADLLEQRLRR
jgi:tetratricopeptide (TPR) repeat protein